MDIGIVGFGKMGKRIYDLAHESSYCVKAVIDCFSDDVRVTSKTISKESLESESFDNNLLDYPNYTKPYEYRGMKVPDVLLSGHHENIKKYRHSEQIRLTKENRPDLLGGSHE